MQNWKEKCSAMVDEQLTQRDITDERVLAAMRKVPRHRFVPLALQDEAYEDRPLPLSDDQTISQPYIIGKMIALAEIDDADKVLEVGTGSGYQTAVLASIAKDVYSIEIRRDLLDRAAPVLDDLKLAVHLRLSDGYLGWPEAAPFDAIIVSAAAPSIPEPLIAQLAEGGRLIIPVDGREHSQALVIVTRDHGRIYKRTDMGVRFVPMVGRVRTSAHAKAENN